MKRNQNRKLFKKKSRSNYKLGCIITIVILIPVLYGVYLYCQQFNTQTQKSNEPQVNTSSQIPSGRNLEIPVSLAPKQEQIIRHTGYTVSYNKDLKLPNWVSYELTRQETKGKEKRSNRFIADPLAIGTIATNADYTRSGYDKGHMAPAADMKWSKQAMEESFYMSNICPQNQKLNRDDWGSLEDVCRKWARKYGTVYIACGPIYDKKRHKCIGKHKVAVPDRFFKVVLIYNRKNPIAMGFLFDNKPHHQALSKYMVSVDQVEEITGLDFFSRLPDSVENKIEAIVPKMPNY